MEELIAEFVAETREGLERVEEGLLALEQGDVAPETVHELFRVLHTIKGTCGFLGLERLREVAHAGENVLAAARDGELAWSEEAIGVVLEAVDRIREIVDVLEREGREPAGDDRALIARIEAVLAGSGAAPAAPATGAGSGANGARDDGAAEDAGIGTGERESSAGSGETVAPAGAADGGSGAPESGTAHTAAPKEAAKERGSTAAGDDVPGTAAGGGADPQRATLRVPVALLDTLMSQVSELVLTRNQLLRACQGGGELDGTLQRLDHVTTELREAVMRARMQPISQAWTGLSRMVRDLSRSLGKKVRLVTEGGETELDRQMLEAIRDPLTHLVRNAVDHGIEPPEERHAAGKPPTGTLRIHARQHSGVIVVTVEDDGRGIDVERVRQKAVERGLVAPHEAAAMPRERVLDLIFLPGFSTARQVSDVSGRGVGMDVVRSRLEKFGGKVEVRTEPGRGTTFLLTLPLTLAIMPALLVETAGLPFAVPQIAVEEVVRIADLAEDEKAPRIDGTRVLRLRDEPLPLVSLAAVLGFAEAQEEERLALVLGVDRRRVAVSVARIRDTEEIVVEPVSSLLRDFGALAGTTVLGDGSVAMVLEPKGLVARASVPSREDLDGGPEAATVRERVTLLRFDAGDGTRWAIPVSFVGRIARLETVDAGGDTALLDDEPLPLVRLEGCEPEGGLVLVLEAEGRRMGLRIAAVRDVAEAELDLHPATSRRDTLGCTVVDGELVHVVDVASLAERVFGPWTAPRLDVGDRPRRVLVVDDSRFFRELLAPILEGHGFEVETAADGREAWARFEAGERFDLLVSDLEMPEMDGFTLARRLAESPWAHVPRIALSSRAEPEDVERALAAGFHAHVSKLDRRALFAALARAVGREHGLREEAA